MGMRVPAGNRSATPRRRTVTTPRPVTVSVARVEVEDERGVLVDPEHPGVRGQELLHHREPALAHVAEARVVRAALGIVPVRHHHAMRAESERAQEIEPIEPVDRVPDLVDLVDGQAEAADGDGGRAREDRDAAMGELVPDGLGHGRAPPRRRAHRSGSPAPRTRGRPRGAAPASRAWADRSARGDRRRAGRESRRPRWRAGRAGRSTPPRAARSRRRSPESRTACRAAPPSAAWRRSARRRRDGASPSWARSRPSP